MSSNTLSAAPRNHPIPDLVSIHSFALISLLGCSFFSFLWSSAYKDPNIEKAIINILIPCLNIDPKQRPCLGYLFTKLNTLYPNKNVFSNEDIEQLLENENEELLLEEWTKYNNEKSKYDIFLHPSNSENFGLVILEAMSCGLFPVVNKKIDWKILDKNELGKSLNFTYKDLKNIEI